MSWQGYFYILFFVMFLIGLFLKWVSIKSEWRQKYDEWERMEEIRKRREKEGW